MKWKLGSFTGVLEVFSCFELVWVVARERSLMPLEVPVESPSGMIWVWDSEGFGSQSLEAGRIWVYSPP